MNTGTTKILVFARAPQAGSTKTRLIPGLGKEGAARMHEELIRRAVDAAFAARLGEVELWCAPSPDHWFFQRLAQIRYIDLRTQSEGDLGERMYQATESALATHEHCLLIGSDCLDYTATYLNAARQALMRSNDAVIGPATDGGYVLLGLTRTHPDLFSALNWGSATVLETTRQRLRDLGWRFGELEALHDIDRPEDIRR